ncbi:putative mitochondrial aconitate hydratase [Acaromyces ingoldii]|uniref:Putative mitochondrial aconitate hydratase n=1 Tax=Acaromyces ingoldii TaxID=215250 RepID=A0A316YNL5_9BASI|nr:putative mitochondrial aconitate hydratase [Acaromyces ingoldii]PWN89643.1 putative mitochondrial aconitate hydratase [Acaromyces ingoldii]
MLATLAQRGATSRAPLSAMPKRTLATAAPPTFHPSRLPPYPRLLAQLDEVRGLLDRPLTLAEKILYTHLRSPQETLADAGRDPSKIRGKLYLPLSVDRLAMQDASAQMALLQFMTCGLDRTAVPSSVHCDHLIQAFEGAEADLQRSVASNKEVFDFLESASKKYGIEFWGPGSGIIHQIVLENYAAPGLLMLGTDSHTPNASGLGCLAIGVGGADAVDAMTNTPWELMAPRILSVHLKGRLSPWCTPKDVILHLAGLLTVRGGTGKIIEYSGPGLASLPATGLATMANMGAEVGATTSAFAYTDEMGRYLTATGRDEVMQQARGAAARGLLSADEGAEYDERVEIDLSTLEPTLNGPFTPDLSTPLSKFVERARSEAERDHPVELSAALIGSCTNSSYADMARCASLAKQASARGLKVKTSFDVTPGSEQVRATVERDGIQAALQQVGARVLANACGPCIGQWNRKELQGEDNVILTSFNRNFRARNDGNAKTMNMLASPEIVTAMAFAGRLDFNPMTDSLEAPDGKPFRFEPPSGEELPSNGFTPGNIGYLPMAMPEPVKETEVAISPSSSRLEYLQPFTSPFAQSAVTGDYELPAMRCLLRVRGKCTTDHISAAGPWLKFKGHLTNIAENTLIGAANDENGQVNSARDYTQQEQQEKADSEEDTIPAMAKRWKARGQPWMLVADHNYGEGSAREHAAIQIRHFDGLLILARSIARIAETNLRKQGVLTLLFENEADYEKISGGDIVETVNLTDLLRPGGDVSTQVRVRVTKLEQDGKTVKESFEIPTKHSLSKAHLDWIRSGSALNLIREKAQQESQAAAAPLGVSGTGVGTGAGIGTRAMSTLARRPRNHRLPSSSRGYATASSSGGKSSTPDASRLSPNDPRYQAPAADSRTEALKRMVFPEPAGGASSRLEAARASDREADAALAKMLPSDRRAEVHDTITRAWLLFQRERREAHEADLATKREMMQAACDSLRAEAPKLFERASYRVALSKRHPSEIERLREAGLLEGQAPREGQEKLSGPERRRRAKAITANRLHGLVPRELRAPTMTPSKKGWPTMEQQDSKQQSS